MASELHVDEIKHSGGTRAMTIDSSGRVTRGVLSSWRVGKTAQQDFTATAGTITWDATSGNANFLKGGVTNNSSTGKVTVPVAGVYMVGSTIRVDNATAGNYILMRLIKNDVTTDKKDYYYHLTDDVSNVYHSVSMSGIFDLSASDTLRVDITAQGDTNWHVDPASYFWGYLVG